MINILAVYYERLHFLVNFLAKNSVKTASYRLIYLSILHGTYAL